MQELNVNYARECVKHWVDTHRLTRWITSHTVLAFFYGIFLFLYEIQIIREYIPILHPLFILWSGIIFVYDIFIRKFWNEVRFWRLLLLFMISAGITAVLCLETGFAANIKSWILTIIPLISFYPVCQLKNANRKKTMIVALLGAAIVVFIASSVALGMYLARISIDVSTLGGGVIGYRYYFPEDPNSGVLLYGIYVDTNHAAIYAVSFFAYSLVLLRSAKENVFEYKWLNILLAVFSILSLLVHFCYFPLANSRGGWLCLIIACFIVVFLFTMFGKFRGRKNSIRIVGALLISVVSILVICSMLLFVRNGLSYVSVVTHQDQNSNGITSDEIEESVVEENENIEIQETPSDDLAAAPPVEQFEGDDPNADEQTLHSEVFEKKDTYVGSGRIAIWSDAIQLFLKRPIFGVNASNGQYFSQKFATGVSTIGQGFAVHNSYLDLLLSYGVLGFAILCTFWIRGLWKVFADIYILKEKMDSTRYIVLFIVLVIAGGSFFLSCVFINTTAMYFLLTVFAGYLLSPIADHPTE